MIPQSWTVASAGRRRPAKFLGRMEVCQCALWKVAVDSAGGLSQKIYESVLPTVVSTTLCGAFPNAKLGGAGRKKPLIFPFEVMSRGAPPPGLRDGEGSYRAPKAARITR